MKRDNFSTKIKKEILKILSKENQPISTQDIAKVTNYPWHSIQTRCLNLQIENKINGFRIGRMNLWQVKK